MEGCSVLPSLCRPVYIHRSLPSQERRGQPVNRVTNQRLWTEGGDGGTSPIWAIWHQGNKIRTMMMKLWTCLLMYRSDSPSHSRNDQAVSLQFLTCTSKYNYKSFTPKPCLSASVQVQQHGDNVINLSNSC